MSNTYGVFLDEYLSSVRCPRLMGYSLTNTSRVFVVQDLSSIRRRRRTECSWSKTYRDSSSKAYRVVFRCRRLTDNSLSKTYRVFVVEDLSSIRRRTLTEYSWSKTSRALVAENLPSSNICRRLTGYLLSKTYRVLVVEHFPVPVADDVWPFEGQRAVHDGESGAGVGRVAVESHRLAESEQHQQHVTKQPV